jgi:hypothetical protein
VGVKKISATILDFAKPLTDGLPAGTPIEARRETLLIAITLWNALSLQACGQGEAFTDLVEHFRKLPAPQSVVMASLVREMVVRRQRLYPHDLRLVGDWELRDLDNGEVSLRAVAHAPPRK